MSSSAEHAPALRLVARLVEAAVDFDHEFPALTECAARVDKLEAGHITEHLFVLKVCTRRSRVLYPAPCDAV